MFANIENVGILKNVW